jgi:hypothetical protein
MSKNFGGPRGFRNACYDTIIVIAFLVLVGVFAVARANEELVQSGTITVNQAQVAFIVSGNVGGGTLSFEEKRFDFTIGGLGVGGFGLSSIEATGEIYNLRELSDFEGLYGQARTGIAVGNVSAGGLWLENPAGVYIRLEAKRKGLALSTGADGIYIKLD